MNKTSFLQKIKNYFKHLVNHHNKQRSMNNSLWLFKNNTYFFWLLFQHLITQKWFKGLIISGGAILILLFRQTFENWAKLHPVFFWFVLFIIIFVFEILKASLKGKNYFGEAAFDLLKVTDISDVKLIDKRCPLVSPSVYYRYVWTFKKEMRVPPVIYIESQKQKSGFVKCFLNHLEVTPSSASFELVIDYEHIGFERDIYSTFTELVIKADAHVFSPVDPRSKLLYLLSSYLPHSKFSFLC